MKYRSKSDYAELTKRWAWGFIAYAFVLVWGSVFVDVSEQTSVAFFVTGILIVLITFTHWLFSW